MLPGIVGLVQATEAVKLLLNIGEPLIGRLLMYDSLGMKFREFKSPKDPGCALCGTKPTILELEKSHAEGAACALPAARALPPSPAAAPVAQRR
ncbi:MAG: adenylyltransferase and [Planctomycetota bacterium]|nr:MAG: adenylyltransferase and [Planctomycetota bacterium]